MPSLSRPSKNAGGSPPAADLLQPTEQAELASMALSNADMQTVMSAVQRERGDSGGGSSGLPHRAALESGFGVDLSGIDAHTGGSEGQALLDKGKAASTTGNKMQFADTPTLETAAHEVAHAVLGHGGGDNKAEEDQADSLAARVMGGEKLELDTEVQGTSGTAYYTIDGDGWKLGETGEAVTNSRQDLIATDKLIDEANSKLKGAGKDGSFIELEGTDSYNIGNGKTGKMVEPKWVDKGAKDGMHRGVSDVNSGKKADTEGETSGSMALWSDCGKSSGAVTGSQQRGDRSGIYNDGGQKKTTKGTMDNSVSGWLRTEPGGFANTVYMELVPKFIKKGENAGFLKEGVHKKTTRYTGFAGWVRGVLGKPKEEVKFIKPKNIKHAKAMYVDLGEDGQDKFDKEAGINHYANPEIGQTYTMATEGDMKGFEKVQKDFTWNYHWAGVVMKDGSDNISLENYAVTRDYAKSKGLDSTGMFINREWNFDMYGTEDKDQTFHQAHLDTGTHGTKATSIAAKADN